MKGSETQESDGKWKVLEEDDAHVKVDIDGKTMVFRLLDADTVTLTVRQFLLQFLDASVADLSAC